MLHAGPREWRSHDALQGCSKESRRMQLRYGVLRSGPEISAKFDWKDPVFRKFVDMFCSLCGSNFQLNKLIARRSAKYIVCAGHPMRDLPHNFLVILASGRGSTGSTGGQNLNFMSRGLSDWLCRSIWEQNRRDSAMTSV